VLATRISLWATEVARRAPVCGRTSMATLR